MNIYKPGTMIDDRYEIVSEPLMGGMAIVYLCLDHSENKPVALKTFKPEYLPDRNARYRFIQEGSIWMQLGKHPNIVECYQIEMVHETDELFIVLELVPKKEDFEDASLRSWLVPGKPLPLSQALLFSIQIVRGMKYAVTKIPGLVHRDLKPENLLVGIDTQLEEKINHLRITDFGLSALLTNHLDEQIKASPLKGLFSINHLKHHTMTNSGIVGTPLYMAPEQWNRKEIGIPIDIFAFGCILYEMLSGETYITGVNIEQIKANCCKQRFINLSIGIPKEVRSIVEQSLELNPNKRFSSWDNLEGSINYAYERIFGQKIPKEDKSSNTKKYDLTQRGYSYITLGDAYVKIGKVTEGQSYYQKAIAIGQAFNDRAIEFLGFMNLGGTFVHFGIYSQAVENYNKALSIAHKSSEKLAEVSALQKIGQLYTTLGDYKNAIKYIQQALDLSDKTDPLSVSFLIDLGNLTKNIGNVSGAMECFNEALKIAKLTGDKSGEASAKIALGIIYKNQGDLDQALKLQESALKISLEIGDRITELGAWVNLGITYKNLGQFNKAIQIYQQALSISREIEKPATEAAILDNLGRIYSINGDNKTGLSYLKQALEICHSIGNKGQELILLNVIGNVQHLLGDNLSAKSSYKKAIQIGQELGNEKLIAENCYDLARLLAFLGESLEALNYAEKAKQIFRLLGREDYQKAQDLVTQIRSYFF